MHFFNFLKWLGILLIFSCGAAAGAYFCSFFKRRCRQAEGYLALLRYIRLQIECFATPLETIFSSCDRKLLLDCGMRGARPRDLSFLLAETDLLLPKNMEVVLTDCANDLGGSYRGEQLRCLDYYISRFLPLCEEMKKELPKWEKLAPLLSAAGSAAAVLLLL